MKDRQGRDHGRDGRYTDKERDEAGSVRLTSDPGRWAQGEERIQHLLELGHLERIQVDVSFVESQLREAEHTLDAAKAATAFTPRAAYVGLYDAARIAVEAVLARQGLRPTRAGGHTVAIDAIEAQLGRMSGIVKPLNRIRSRRVDAEYPYPNTQVITSDEVDEDLKKAREIVTSMQKFVHRVGEF